MVHLHICAHYVLYLRNLLNKTLKTRNKNTKIQPIQSISYFELRSCHGILFLPKLLEWKV